MQPSEFEILREVETLRDIRRRSTAGGPILDPDLPSASPQSPTSSGYWTPSATDDSSSSSHEDSSEGVVSDGADDPSHLFWVPARLHPEIAPAEFRAFLKEHARAPSDGSAIAGVSRSSSVSSVGGGLGRKRSMLSRQYKPSANDGIEDEEVLPIRRRTSVFSNPGPQLTISDLQKLEELAEEASTSDDPSRLRSVLRRSLSLNVSPSALGHLDDSSDMADEADSPIIVPRPGQILRRAARTRKAGTVDGPHRFTSNRARRASSARAKTADHRISSDRSSSDHGDPSSPTRHSGESDIPSVPPLPRPDSYSEESSIYDAYASPDPDETDPTILFSEPEPIALGQFLPPVVSQPEPREQDFPIESPIPPVLHHPQPKRALSPPAPEIPPVERTPSPETPSPSASPAPAVQPIPVPRPSLQESALYQPSTSPTPEQYRREKDKDKKGLFGKWGGDKGGKKGKGGEKEKEKDSGFFGSLFGTKKKQEEPVAPPMGLGGSGRETAAALLGAPKSSRSRAPSPTPEPVNGYSRYPIHVERAIYRLSHIKLANPRRPLYEQVLISNLMFWYLGVINNKATSPAANATPANPVNTPVANGATAEKEQQAQAERERKEREEHEKAEREKERERQAEQKREPRRGSLTKNNAAGAPASRRAEMPVRGPQYDMQHRAMEQEYGGYGQQRSPSAPPAVAGYQHPQGRGPSGQPNSYSSVQLVQPQPQQAQQYYNGSANPHQHGQAYPMNHSSSSLPPGAMPPVNVEQGGWMSQPQHSARPQQSSPSPPPRTMSPPTNTNNSGQRRARSPPVQPRYTPAQEKQPPQPYQPSARLPGRSLSATAAAPAPQQANGKVRKGGSVQAVTPSHLRANSEEEDLPLAYYQQRRK
ncbi:hypothetical protein BXZ70DRAFT_669737 [Cristinia sonorae]|uniref:Protein Zds1 C-terminal domain-containing protein n=1 Tax=Cristinia sonorae TaxID=1940300 RepID=A0A8K0XT32_9AGAR|nr:hypothetical protein BXZ70DRAFT_669737 [Cristinia sonorae]